MSVFFKKRAGGSSSDDKKSSAQQPRRKAPWTEKYRPKTLDDVAAQDAIVSVLKKSVGRTNLPHMLFYGPPGTGKTSTILALAKDIFGSNEVMKSRVLELNASDDRGIDVVRDKIKTFSRGVVSAAPGVPDFKLIILDEADMMTQDAQSALRRIMETYSRITRFCLICNYVTRIIDPLASRCSKFRFQELSKDDVLARLRYICEQEKVNLGEEGDKVLMKLLQISKGDLRRCITLLQSATGLVEDGEPVTVALVDELSGTVPEDTIDTLITAMKRGNIRRLETVVSNLTLEGWSVANLIDDLHDSLLTSYEITPEAKSKIALTLSEADRRLVDGADEQIELLNVATQISTAIKV